MITSTFGYGWHYYNRKLITHNTNIILNEFILVKTLEFQILNFE
jgi:hypothetical protein